MEVRELTYEEMESINGGNFLDGFCSAVALFTTGAGIYVLAGGSIATGGALGYVWAGAVVGCTVYGVYKINK